MQAVGRQYKNLFQSVNAQANEAAPEQRHIAGGPRARALFEEFSHYASFVLNESSCVARGDPRVVEVNAYWLLYDDASKLVSLTYRIYAQLLQPQTIGELAMANSDAGRDEIMAAVLFGMKYGLVVQSVDTLCVSKGSVEP